MKYTFRQDQVVIFNELIYDSSISLKSIENLVLVDNYLEFEIERRTFENVTRDKQLLFNYTYLNGKTSIVRFENVSDLVVTGLAEPFMTNHFINGITSIENNILTIETAFGLEIKMKTNASTTIYLVDLKDSDYGKGTINGIAGFTEIEWTDFLKKEKYNLTTI